VRKPIFIRDSGKAVLGGECRPEKESREVYPPRAPGVDQPAHFWIGLGQSTSIPLIWHLIAGKGNSPVS